MFQWSQLLIAHVAVYPFDRFGFIPKTFVLPGDMKALKAAFDKEGVKKKWIVKPPASARGSGIQVSTIS